MSIAVRSVTALVAVAGAITAVAVWMGAPGEDAVAEHRADRVRRPLVTETLPPGPPAPERRVPGIVGPGAGGDQDGGLPQWAAAAGEEEEEALRDSIYSVPSDPNIPLDQVLAHYKGAVREGFERLESSIDLQAQRGMLTEVFLRKESVQARLATMSPFERRRELAYIREEMGFSEEEIARLEERDAVREERWTNGLAYMEARGRAVSTFEGAALEAELVDLREEYFGRRAGTIAAEEERGFFRFERPRVYGRN